MIDKGKIKYGICFAVGIMVVFASCRKTTNITNNYPTSHKPAFTVQGLTDTVISLCRPVATSSFTVHFEDSVSEQVSLELSGLPAGITIPSPWAQAGYPTFKSIIPFAERDTLHPALPGIYPLTLTCKGQTAASRQFKYNLTVQQDPLYTDFIAGTFSSCSTSVASTLFTSNVINDSLVHNKVTISNFANTGQSVAAVVYPSGTSIYYVAIPYQNTDTFTFVGSGTFNTANSRLFTLSMKINGKSRNVTFK
jgi:hypothetical protein